MKIGSYAAALGSIEQQKRLDVISNNIANASTSGYKRDDVHFRDFLYETTYTETKPGPVKETQNPLDIALVGDGYLKVQTDQGILYSRAGNLTLNQERTLVTAEGYPVLGQNGPIQLQDDTSSVETLRIESDGQVFDGDNSIDTLDIVQFPKETILRKTKGVYLKPMNDQDQPTQAENCSVKQGSIEGANFNVVEEMTRMVDTMRMFEAYQKVLQTTHQDLDGAIISKLGGP
ncbi:MAG: flagellar hook-basal body protein [Acidobacteriota bacterium]